MVSLHTNIQPVFSSPTYPINTSYGHSTYSGMMGLVVSDFQLISPRVRLNLKGHCLKGNVLNKFNFKKVADRLIADPFLPYGVFRLQSSLQA